MGKYEELDFSGIRTYSVADRRDLVHVEDLVSTDAPVSDWGGDALCELARRIVEARRTGRPVIWSQGAHVIKNRLSLYLIDLVRRGIVTHVAGNGACSIHDFELAYHGATSEDVPTAIEDGSFGMWEETGRWMNDALREGNEAGMGYGESLGSYVDRHRDLFPHRDVCIFYECWRRNVPCTYHIALGTDIIHQHPSADFGVIGETSGRDFHIYCASVSKLDGGVFLNFGSSVIGAEVFLKALSISRNLGHPTFRITTADFDLRDLGDFRSRIGYEDPDYYYRPRKNIVNRPTSRGGWGWHFTGDHQVTIPNLYRRILEIWEAE